MQIATQKGKQFSFKTFTFESLKLQLGLYGFNMDVDFLTIISADQ
jgi:hypothetical protein